MAKWTSSGDITKDLDCLSEMTCGKRVTTTSPIFRPPVARGKHAAHDEQPVIMDPFEDHRNGFGHYRYTVETMKGFGRGEVIDKMWKTLHKKPDCDLQWQLRAACGAGYSNDLIENAFRQDSASDKDSDQFEDVCKTEDATSEMETEGTSRSTSTSDISATNDPGSSDKTLPAATGPPAAADAPVSAENNNTAALEKSPSRELVKRKPRKYTNILMDSLIRMKGASEDSSILSTTKLNPDAQPFECQVSVNTSSVQTENLNPDAQPFECLISVDSVSSNQTNDRLPPIHQASSSRTPPKNHKYSYPVRPTSRTYGYTDLVSYDNRPVHHANDFFCVDYDPVPIQDFQFRSEEFPPLS